ncbi:hypothetical protein HOB10_04790 [Candidatus Parcubacteria bacterium]|jgi:hypothetical protein|nr:hypothetical protein [Candidatus Parcubacteria bacterium]
MRKIKTFIGRCDQGKTNAIHANPRIEFDYGVSQWIEENVEPDTEMKTQTALTVRDREKLEPEIVFMLTIEYTPKSSQ